MVWNRNMSEKGDEMQLTKLNEPYLGTELQEELLSRLVNIEGHTRGIRRMLTNHEECERILVQLAATKAAMNQVSIKLLEGHIEFCVKEFLSNEDARKVVDKLKSAVITGLKM